MKKILFLSIVISSALVSCDKVENAYPENAVSNSLDWSLYPDGDSAHYYNAGLWPTFAANSNTLRNVLIEDFTGHQCVNCPNSTANMEQLIATNPTRVFGVAIHAGANGLSGFQIANSELPEIFYCDEGLEIGLYFGQNMAGSSFVGNPAFNVNRTKANNQFTSGAGSAIANKTSTCLAAPLKVNIQAVTNYFPSTRGLFLHTEVDKIDAGLTSDLAVVVYVIEDSLVAKQLITPTLDPDGSPGDPDTPDGVVEEYVHRDIMRGTIDGRTFGKTLTAADLGSNGKYFLSYSYKLPSQYEAENMKLYIYVYDKTTMEIYQVIEKHFL
jgi:hypothetical protein